MVREGGKDEGSVTRRRRRGDSTGIWGPFLFMQRTVTGKGEKIALSRLKASGTRTNG